MDDESKSREELIAELRELRERLAITEPSPDEGLERLRLLAETIEDVFWVEDPGITKSHYVSPAYERVWERSRAEFEADPRAYMRYVHPDDRVVLEAAVPLHEQGIWDHEYRIVRPDGSIRWIQDRGSPIRDADGQVVRMCGVARDITAQKEVEVLLRKDHAVLEEHIESRTAELHASRQRLSIVLEGLPAFVYLLGQDYRIRYANRCFVETFGEYEGKTCYELTSNRTSPCEPCSSLRAFEEEGPPEWEWTDPCDGRVYRILAYRMPGEEGVPMILELGIDITAQRNLERQLQAAQRMESIGRLAGGIAHDFNNILAVIKSFGGFVYDELEERDPARSDMNEILGAVERANQLTRQLLAFGQRQVVQRKTLDLGKLLLRLDKLLRRTIGEHIQLRTNSERGLGAVRADVGQVEQIIVNLVMNARDAMPAGGTLHIETFNVTFDEETARDQLGIEAGDYVALSVADTGHGIAPEHLDSVFEPFFTTKPEGKGTGLGLAMVYGIVSQNDGVIRVASEPEAGTIFEVYFPRVTGIPKIVSFPAPSLDKATGDETLLLVEDDDLVRRALSRMLDGAGYTVFEARSGGDAIVTAKKMRGEIDLLVTDMIMPQMNGSELAERLVESYPQLRVLYMSGYLGDEILSRDLGDIGKSFLEKPFSEQQFLAKIREVLDR